MASFQTQPGKKPAPKKPGPPDPGADPTQDPTQAAPDPTADPMAAAPDPLSQAGMGSPLAQAGMPMIGGAPQPPPMPMGGGGMGGGMGLGMPGIGPPMDGGMMMHPSQDLLGPMAAGLPPGGSVPASGDSADSPLLAALMASMSPNAVQGGDINLQGLGPGDPNDGMMGLLQMLGLSKMGVQPSPGGSGVPYTDPNIGAAQGY